MQASSLLRETLALALLQMPANDVGVYETKYDVCLDEKFFCSSSVFRLFLFIKLVSFFRRKLTAVVVFARA